MLNDGMDAISAQLLPRTKKEEEEVAEVEEHALIIFPSLYIQRLPAQEPPLVTDEVPNRCSPS
jgi:hypothetical protein